MCERPLIAGGRDACSGREQQRGENPDSCELVALHRSILSNNGLRYDQALASGQHPTDLGRNSKTAGLIRAGIEYAAPILFGTTIADG